MKKITSEEYNQLKLHGLGSSGPYYNMFMKMEPGDSIILYRSEWYKKYPPTTILNRIERKYNMKFDRGALPDRTGWAIRRVS